jgi:hypothetical protein
MMSDAVTVPVRIEAMRRRISGQWARMSQTRSIPMASADPIFEQMTLIDAGGDEGITLQVEHLAVAIRRDAHVTDQHVRKTSFNRFPHIASFRQGLSHIFRPNNDGFSALLMCRRKSGDSRQTRQHMPRRLP